MSSNMTIRLQSGKAELINAHEENWTVHLVDTGPKTNTGGRLKRLEPWLKDDTFMLTYGDGVSNIDLNALIDLHRSQDCIATLSAVRPPARFGSMTFDGDRVTAFTEKPQIGEGWINGGFLVMEPAIFDYLESDDDSLETDALARLAHNGQLGAYRHDGFWQCMDTLREKRILEALWQSGNAPWQVR
jgi:glucose-1-phosphate cytidylyltransferase